MADQRIEPVTGTLKGELRRYDEQFRTISKETADRIFIGMMHDQARFGVRRSLVGSGRAEILSDFRGALSPRHARR